MRGRGSRGAVETPLLLPTAPAMLRHQAARCGDGSGLVYAGHLVTFGALADAAAELGAWLGRRGVGAGQTVGVMAANTPAYVAALYAVWGVGGIVVPISPRATPAEVTRMLDHVRAAALVCDPPRAETAREAARATGIASLVCRASVPLAPRLLTRGGRRQRSARTAAPACERVAAIAYTSGSTGTPRGVTLTHGNFLWATFACVQARGDSAESVGACLSPLTHVPVLVSHLLSRVLMGGRAVLLDKFNVGALLEAIERHAISEVPLIGGMVFDMVSCGSVSEGVRRQVTKVSVGGAPTPMASKHQLAAMFPQAEIIEAYGQTESTDGVLMARGRSVFEREGTVGRMNPHVRVAIRRSDGTLAEPGEEGEIVVAGPTVMQRYHRDREATLAALRDGWLHTGDLGRCDGDGFFFVTGRVKDLIISGGENVSPAEVEAVLRQHPDVADVAVIGTPHPRWGEQVTAVVVRRDGVALDAAALEHFAASRLAAFKRPRRVEFVATLPRNAHNKVETHVLRRQLGEG